MRHEPSAELTWFTGPWMLKSPEIPRIVESKLAMAWFTLAWAAVSSLLPRDDIILQGCHGIVDLSRLRLMGHLEGGEHVRAVGFGLCLQGRTHSEIVSALEDDELKVRARDARLVSKIWVGADFVLTEVWVE